MYKSIGIIKAGKGKAHSKHETPRETACLSGRALSKGPRKNHNCHHCQKGKLQRWCRFDLSPHLYK